MSRLETDEELQSRLLRTYPTGYSESGIRELCTGRALDDLAKWHGTKRMTVPEQEEGMKRTDNGMRWWEERERERKERRPNEWAYLLPSQVREIAYAAERRKPCKSCPVCGSPLYWSEMALECGNPLRDMRGIIKPPVKMNPDTVSLRAECTRGHKLRIDGPVT